MIVKATQLSRLDGFTVLESLTDEGIHQKTAVRITVAWQDRFDIPKQDRELGQQLYDTHMQSIIDAVASGHAEWVESLRG